MSANIIQAQYDQLETISHRFQLLADHANGMLNNLLEHMNGLRTGGWQGEGATSFFKEMDDEIFPAANRLRDAMTNSSQTTRDIIQILSEAEQQAAVNFLVGEPGILTSATGSILPHGDDPSNSSEDSFKTSPTMKGVPGLSKTFSIGAKGDNDLVDFSAVISQRSFSESGTVWSETFEGRFGHLQLDYSTYAGYSVGLDDDGLEVDFAGEVETYVFKGVYDKALFGDQVKLGGEFIAGGEASLQGQLEINPLEGDLELELEAEAFLGVKAEGSATVDIGPVTLSGTGTVGVGAGGAGHVDFGLDNWQLEFSAGASGFIGVGAGGRGRVTVDLREVYGWVIN